MKKVNDTLANYLKTENEFLTFDLFRYKVFLESGSEYTIYLTDAPVDIEIDNILYKSNKAILERDSTMLQDTLSVDELSFILHIDKLDSFNIGKETPIMQLAQEGKLDHSTLLLSRAYFVAKPDNFGGHEYLGKIDLFTGECSVESAETLTLNMVAKSKATGLALPYPVRRFFPAGSYTTDASGIITRSNDDNRSCLVPLKPSQTCLM